MKNFFKVVVLGAVMASSSLVSAAQEAQKMAVVFPSKIMQQSPQREKIEKKLQAEFKGRIDSLKALEKEISDIESKLERDGALMAESEVTNLQRKRAVKISEFKLEREAFSEDSRRRQNEEYQKSKATLLDVINSVATKNGYDVVLNGEQILFAAPELDISNLVIKEISKR